MPIVSGSLCDPFAQARSAHVRSGERLGSVFMPDVCILVGARLIRRAFRCSPWGRTHP